MVCVFLVEGLFLGCRLAGVSLAATVFNSIKAVAICCDLFITASFVYDLYAVLPMPKTASVLFAIHVPRNESNAAFYGPV